MHLCQDIKLDAILPSVAETTKVARSCSCLLRRMMLLLRCGTWSGLQCMSTSSTPQHCQRQSSKSDKCIRKQLVMVVSWQSPAAVLQEAFITVIFLLNNTYQLCCTACWRHCSAAPPQ